MRRPANISLPGIVSSVLAKSYLVEALNSRVKGLANTTELVEAVALWTQLSGGAGRPITESSLKQKSCKPICKAKFETFLKESNYKERVRLLAAAESESGMWLQAIPVPSLGSQMNSDTLTVAAIFRIRAR